MKEWIDGVAYGLKTREDLRRIELLGVEGVEGVGAKGSQQEREG